LFDGKLAVAAAPSLIKKIDIHSYDSLNGQTLIVHENRPDGWRNWAKGLGIPQPKAGKILRFDSMAAVMQATASGLGFAIVYLPLSQQWIKNESIRPVFDADVISKEKFYLAHRPEDGERSEITQIIDWFFSELAKYKPEPAHRQPR
jgi:DNA-binding transcriptional LysR family regulator